MFTSGPIPLGLYVHLPWCLSKCPYCDFNSHEAPKSPPYDDYVAAVLRDFSLEYGLCAGRSIETIFIGGGTPSLFPASAVSCLLEGIASRAKLVTDIEISLEVNPEAIAATQLDAYRAAGINRISIGAQSFRDQQLQLIGRVHDAATTLKAAAKVQAAGFDNVNLDLMYGLPGDTVAAGLADLDTAIELAPSHISWYELTIESGTAFARSRPRLPSRDLRAELYQRGQEKLESKGFIQYEISAYARAGRRARHNLNYWMFGDYIGVGAGAHGKITRGEEIFRREKRRSPQAYLSFSGSGPCTCEYGPLSISERLSEFAMNALRLRHGFDEHLFARAGISQKLVDEALVTAEKKRWVKRANGRVCPTNLGYRFLDDLSLLFVDPVRVDKN